MTRIACTALAAALILLWDVSGTAAQSLRSGTEAVTAEGNVLVLGGTGRLGSRVVKRLIELGFDVAVLVRPTSKRERLQGVDVEFIVGDVTIERDMQLALEGRRFHTVIDALAASGEVDFRPEQPGERQLMPYAPGQVYLARWGNVGIDHVILHSTTGSGNGDNAADYPDINFESFGDILIEKGKGEQALLDSGRTFTIIRSGAIIVDTVRGAVSYTGKGYLSEDTKLVGPVSYDDLGILVADCALAEGCMNKELHASDDSLGEDYAYWRCQRFRSSPDEVC